MPFFFNRFSGLLLIFFIHGLVYAGLLLYKGLRDERRSDYWLSLFLLLCILYIAPWMLGFAGWYDDCQSCRNFLFYFPFQHTLLMGPVLYFYVRSLLSPGQAFTRRDWLHFIPPALYVIWCTAVAIIDRLILQRYYLMNGHTDPDFDTWYLIAGLLSLLLYLFLSISYYRRYKRFIVQQFSFADAVTFRWVRNVLLAFFVYFLSNLLFHLVQFAGVSMDYIDSWWYYLLFALLLYYIAINGYSNSIERRMDLQLHLNTAGPLLLTGETVAVTEDIPFEEMPAAQGANNELSSWKEAIERLMAERQLYKDPDLTLARLASAVGAGPGTVSRVINGGFGMNFNDFVNRYRVEAVKAQLLQPEGQRYTIMSLAYDAGFNSKATFNRAFKKITGKNPKDFYPGNPS